MAAKYEMSKTYQYRKVMKPLLERKRRARINKCLEELKDLVAECIQQQSGDSNVKLEKADILELTVQHFRQMKTRRQQGIQEDSGVRKHSFRSGYIKAANEVSRCLATMPNVDIALGTKLMTHLGLRLNQLESTADVCSSPVHTPLTISCASISMVSSSPSLCSSVSSGYSSDSENAYSPLVSKSANQGLLQISSSLWRPW